MVEDRSRRGRVCKALNSEERRGSMTPVLFRSLMTSSILRLAGLQVKPRTLLFSFLSVLSQSNVFGRCRLNNAYYRLKALGQDGF